MDKIRRFELKAQQELRVEVDLSKNTTLKMTRGTAEIFGTEVARDREYAFSGTKFAVFTWRGCFIEIIGDCHAYVGKDTPMASYAELHGTLELQRMSAAEGKAASGPRVVLVGPTDTGKSSITKLLVNYGARLGHKLLYVDVDVGQGGIMPGMLSCMFLERPIDFMDPFSCTRPLLFFYGDTSPSKNAELYKSQMSNMLAVVEKLIETDPEACAGGIIANTCGWVTDVGYSLLKHFLSTLKASHVLVLDHERLFNDLSEEMSDVHVGKLQKSGGVVTRSATFRRHARMNNIRRYFYGANGDLSPSSRFISFDDLQIFRVGGPAAPSTALPIGAERTLDANRPLLVSPSKDMTHSILGVSYAESQDDLLSTNLAGFLHITEVNMELRRLTVLSPTPGPLAFKLCLLGNLKWLE